MDNYVTEYRIPFYKFNIMSDINLEIFTDIDLPTITMCSCFEKVAQQQNIIEEIPGLFKIDSPIASYSIDFNQNIIKVSYENIENIRATLYNLPAAVWATYSDDLLLHASSIYADGKIVAFCAEKGTGKSTLISFLGKEYPIFSDDTVYLTETSDNILCYSCSKFLKLTMQTCSTHSSLQMSGELFDSAPKTLQSKAYIDPLKLNLRTYKNASPPVLSTICFLHRLPCSEFKIRIINSPMEKASLLLNNCVGIEYFSPSMIKRILNSIIYKNTLSNIKFVHIYIPDSLTFLANNYKNLLQNL